MTDGNPPQGNPAFQPYVDPNTGQPVPGYVVDPTTGQPIPQPTDAAAAQPAPQPASGAEQPVADNTFGFTEAPVQEKYNTEYIVSSMQKNQRSSRTLIIGLVIAGILGVIMWTLLMPAPQVPSLDKKPEEAAAEDAPKPPEPEAEPAP